MAALLFRRSFFPSIFATSIVAAPLILRPQSLLIRCDAPSSPSSSPTYSYTRDARTPLLTSQGRPNPATFRQISLGSILGVLGGLAVSVFSKPLTILLGLLLCGVYGLESRGIKIVSNGKLASWAGRKVDGLAPEDVRSAALDNLAFKLAFGSAFALAGFGSLTADK